MTYATRTDLEQRYGADELTQRESMLPVGAIERALADADAEIDGYCSGRYALPLAPVPATIPQLACLIARYRLLGDAGPDDRARKDYEDALRYLREVQSARASLAGVALLTGSATVATVSLTNGRSKVFGGGLA